jgi:hypothetical protein
VGSGSYTVIITGPGFKQKRKVVVVR